MLISHRHRFIFIHNRKAAGSSITAYLNRFMGPEDIQIGVWRDVIRHGGCYNRRILREVFSHDGLRAVGYYTRKLRLPHFSRFVERVQEYEYQPLLKTTNIAHPPAAAVRDAFPYEWTNYLKFCVVRNPFDKVVSDYEWMTRKLPPNRVTFTEFLERLADPGRPDPEGVVPQPRTNWPLYTINDEVVADFVCRFENLATDMKEVSSMAGIQDGDGDIPQAKTGSRSAPYRSYFGERERSLVQQLSNLELSLFEYQF